MADGISELFLAICSWMATQHLKPFAGLVEATTPDVAPGPIRVRLNASKHEQDGVAPYDAVLIHSTSEWPIGVVNPAGGALMSSRNDLENEAGLIAHFRALAPDQEET